MPKKIEKPKQIHFAIDYQEFESSSACKSIISAYKADEMDTYLEAIADVEGLGTMIHTTRAWQALHLEVQAEILVDVKKHLAVAISNRIKGEVEL